VWGLGRVCVTTAAGQIHCSALLAPSYKEPVQTMFRGVKHTDWECYPRTALGRWATSD
jgi:hypothetical protein